MTELNCSTQDNVQLLLSVPTELPTVIQNSFFMLLSWFGGYLLIECYYIIKGVLFLAFGEGTGSLLSLFVVAFIYGANYIKIEYHNTFFT